MRINNFAHSKVIRGSQNLEIGPHHPKPRPLDPLLSNGWKQCKWPICIAFIHYSAVDRPRSIKFGNKYG